MDCALQLELGGVQLSRTQVPPQMDSQVPMGQIEQVLG